MGIKPPSEAAFQQQVLDLALHCGWLRVHFKPVRVQRSGRRPYHETPFDGDKGFPDTVLCHPKRGLLLFAELKTDSGRVEPEQLGWIAALQAAGAAAVVWRPAHWPEIERTLKGE